MTDGKLSESDRIIATLHFALTMLWVEEFLKRDNPIEAAKAYAASIGDLSKAEYRPPTALSEEAQSDIFADLTIFFENVVSQLLLQTKHPDS